MPQALPFILAAVSTVMKLKAASDAKKAAKKQANAQAAIETERQRITDANRKLQEERARSIQLRQTRQNIADANSNAAARGSVFSSAFEGAEQSFVSGQNSELNLLNQTSSLGDQNSAATSSSIALKQSSAIDNANNAFQSSVFGAVTSFGSSVVGGLGGGSPSANGAAGAAGANFSPSITNFVGGADQLGGGF